MIIENKRSPRSWHALPRSTRIRATRGSLHNIHRFHRDENLVAQFRRSETLTIWTWDQTVRNWGGSSSNPSSFLMSHPSCHSSLWLRLAARIPLAEEVLLTALFNHSLCQNILVTSFQSVCSEYNGPYQAEHKVGFGNSWHQNYYPPNTTAWFYQRPKCPAGLLMKMICKIWSKKLPVQCIPTFRTLSHKY